MARKTSKKGKPRKSRRARLPLALAWIPLSCDFDLSGEQWIEIAGVYDALAGDGRVEVCVLCRDYIQREGFESRAPFVEDAVKWLANAESAAARFLEAITQNSEAIGYARVVVDEEIAHPVIPSENRLRVVEGVMRDVAASFGRAREEIERDAGVGIEEGAAWVEFILRLADFLKSRGCKVSASKGSDKSDRSSPFVQFVRELQKAFPASARRHAASDAALSQAISKVLGQSRPQKNAPWELKLKKAAT